MTDADSYSICIADGSCGTCPGGKCQTPFMIDILIILAPFILLAIIAQIAIAIEDAEFRRLRRRQKEREDERKDKK